MNNFSTSFKIFAFPPQLIAQLPELIENFGDEAADGNLIVKTICCGYDDSAMTRFRALRFPETVSLTELTDGRFAYTALWSNALLEAFKSGMFPEVQELTQEELAALLPVVEEPLIEEPIAEEPLPDSQ
jgi:hypothetical protein